MENKKIKECIDGEKNKDNEVTKNNNSVNIVNIYQKYLKYKLKYTRMKRGTEQ